MIIENWKNTKTKHEKLYTQQQTTKGSFELVFDSLSRSIKSSMHQTHKSKILYIKVAGSVYDSVEICPLLVCLAILIA
jgi:hypothetical protein